MRKSIYLMVGSIVVGSMALMAMACAETPSASPDAETKPATLDVESQPKVAKTPRPAGQLALVPANSTVGFVGAKVIGSHEGIFEKFSGTIDYKNGDPTTAKISVSIDMSSVKTDSEKLDQHLKSPDFFDVQKFPQATFVSSSVTAGGAPGSTHTVSGKLALHGVTKDIKIPAKIVVSNDTMTMSAELIIDRKDFGIVYPGMPDNLIKDDVQIKLKTEGKL